MILQYINSSRQSDVESYIESLVLDEKISAVIVYCSENALQDEERFSEFLHKQNKPVIGGLFPGIIVKSKLCKVGTLVVGVERPVETATLPFSSDYIETGLMPFSERIKEDCLLMMFFDGLSAGVEEFKEALFYNLGLSYQYFGGGTGKSDFSKGKTVFSNEGLMKDAAVIIAVPIQVGIGVAHGWHPVTDEIKVSKAYKNIVYELNGKPALEVYLDVIHELLGERITADKFQEYSKRFPFGIAKMSSDMVVRDPIDFTEDKGIVCVGEIPNGSFVHILSGSVRSLVNGAMHAKNVAQEHYDRKTDVPGFYMMVDCISRYMFLDEAYEIEIDAMSINDLYGVLSLGEIANTGDSYLELYNKTVVLCIMEV